ncbi:acyl-CoA dehydratase activase-related protein [Calderihabitans maritimus]|uniref:DUF2229 domain-containing protein n=1 Tax=Calderihabitans maritimus TaxID=1246530 RepID=A0A1Z5HPR8_9FIRM|nr:acyl-CoA dehydratase activase-related protein [Calderihabitans maritimus]GAW91357.1 hypothetical protein TherJR_1649 [Calderihabitans maritimus]
MAVKIGIPRALFYYYYYPLWQTFFMELGAEVLPSPSTNKKILDDGISRAVDETCLPVKLFYGHVMNLKEKVDCIFVPRLIGLERKAYICPKLMGLPDMIKANIPGLPDLLVVDIDLSRREEKLYQAVFQTGLYFTQNPFRIRKAWNQAVEEQERYQRMTWGGVLPCEALKIMEGQMPKVSHEGEFRVALLGHGYNLYDHHTSMDVIGKLRRLGTTVVTSDNVPREVIEREASRLPKRMFWTLGKRIIGAAFHFLQDPRIKGIIHLASFGCGPDSMIGELVERYIRRTRKLPFLMLTVDEHTGEAGVATRLEAFVDMLALRGAWS